MTDTTTRPAARADSAVSLPVVLHARVVSGAGGGPEKTILSSPRFLQELGYQGVCAYMRPPGDAAFEALRKRAAQWDAPLEVIDDRGAWDLRVVTQLLRLCRQYNVAIWHGHDYKSNALGLLLQRFWPMRLVTTVHGWVRFTRRTPLYYGIDRFCLKYYERVICVSPDLQERCLEAGVPQANCLLVENAIDVQKFQRQVTIEEAKRRLGFDPGRVLVGAAGRLSEEKGFDRLVRAVDPLLARGLPVDLVILGEGDQKPQLQKLIADLGRQDQIRLLGFRDDVTELYQAMDVFCLSSLREGLPNVLLEAMALGVPVVSTRVAGVPHLIEHERNGLLVEPGNEMELTAALERIVTDEGQFRERLRTAARQTIETRYCFAKRMQKITAIYDDLLGRATAAHAS